MILNDLKLNIASPLHPISGIKLGLMFDSLQRRYEKCLVLAEVHFEHCLINNLSAAVSVSDHMSSCIA